VRTLYVRDNGVSIRSLIFSQHRDLTIGTIWQNLDNNTDKRGLNLFSWELGRLKIVSYSSHIWREQWRWAVAIVLTVLKVWADIAKFSNMRTAWFFWEGGYSLLYCTYHCGLKFIFSKRCCCCSFVHLSIFFHQVWFAIVARRLAMLLGWRKWFRRFEHLQSSKCS